MLLFFRKTVDVSATRYGRQHEESAILSYVNHQRAHGVMVSVQPCGMNVDESSPWLAASPDGIILDPTQSADSQKGCLEVKCPILCEKSLILDLSRNNSTFCLKEKNGRCSCQAHMHTIIKFEQKCMLPDCRGVTLLCGHQKKIYFWNVCTTIKPLWMMPWLKPKPFTSKSI